MKHNLHFLSIIILILSVSCGNSSYDEKASVWIDTLEEIPQDKIKDCPSNAPYSFEKGVIEYESSTLGIKQQVIMMFKDFGRISSTEIKSTILGQKINKLSLINDTAIFDIDLITNSAYYILNDSSSDNDINFRDLDKKTMQENDIIKGEQEKVLGKICTIYELTLEKQNAEIKNWIWEGLTLKSVSNMAGIKVTMIAKKIRVNVEIPDEKFDLPDNIKLHKGNDSLFVQ